MTAARLLTLSVILLSALPRDAQAWSRDGHRIVCRIAWQLLDQARRSEIERLTSSYRDPDGQPLPSFFDACAFADDVRAKANHSQAWSRFAVFETWHYANVPRTTTLLASPPCQVMCVISAIPAHADSLRRAANNGSRTEALVFLGHWIGDLHQPLHLGFADDRGGNDVRPIDGDFYAVNNLHALWDVGLLGKILAGGSWQDFGDRLARDITPAQQAAWRLGAPVDWAQESYTLVTSTGFQYCDWQLSGGAATCVARPGSRTLGESYLAEFGDDVVTRLQQAGVRLAEMIRAHLAVP